jgi:hypothetical protein
MLKKLLALAALINLCHSPAFASGFSGGSGSSGVVLISEQTPSGTGTVTFSSISTSYRDLIVRIRGRGTTAATAVNVNVTVNNDTGGNYDLQQVRSNSTNATASGSVTQTAWVLNVAGASAPAGVSDYSEVVLVDYNNATLHKTAHIKGSWKVGSANTNLNVWSLAGWWRSTAAITRVDVALASGNWDTGSVISLYGVR